MSRAEVEARSREGSGVRKASSNPANRLVPYLDLFGRLGDDELSRLARAPLAAVEGLRQQVEEVNRGLGRYQDLLPRLSDDELARLTGASTKTIRFWRLSQPRHLQGEGRRRNPDRPDRPDRNPDLTPSPQPLPDREASASHSNGIQLASSSSTELTELSTAEMQVRALEESSDYNKASASQSATLIIDTYEG